MPTSLTLAHILEKLPSLQILIKEYGELSLYDYACKYYRTQTNTHHLFVTRKQELLGYLDRYITGKFDSQLAQKVRNSLEKNYSVSTAEHHGPMGHPFFFQSALLRGAVNTDIAIVNFCTSHVSLGNSSYPRGIIFHGDGPSAPEKYLHIPLFSANQRMCPVFGLPAYTPESQGKIFSKMEGYRNNGIVTDELFSDLTHFVNEHLFNEKILSTQTYSEQITQLNTAWWNETFPDMPAYIPLDAEDIVCDLLLNHLHNHTLLTRIMTDISIQPLLEQYFNGISCCFDLADKTGTYLFWYLDEHNVRHSLNWGTSNPKPIRYGIIIR